MKKKKLKIKNKDEAERWSRDRWARTIPNTIFKKRKTTHAHTILKIINWSLTNLIVYALLIIYLHVL